MGNHQGVNNRKGNSDDVFGVPTGYTLDPCPFKVPLIHQVVKARDHVRLQKMINSGAKVNSHDQDGMTPLHYAAAQGDYQSVALLINCGAQQTPCKLNIYPIHLAVQNGDQRVISLILDSGGNVDSCDSMGTTPLGLSIEFNAPDLVALLLQRKAYNGPHCLLIALQQGLLDVARVLITYNPSIVAGLKLDRYRFTSKGIGCLQLLHFIDYQFDDDFAVTNRPESPYFASHIDYIDRQYDVEMKHFNDFVNWLKKEQRPMELKFLARISFLKACGSNCVDQVLDEYQQPIPWSINQFLTLKRIL